MFAQASLTIDCESAKLAALLSEPSGSWSVEPSLDPEGMARIETTRARADSGDGRRLLPLRWSSIGGSAPVSQMEGVVAIETDVNGGSRMTVSVTFDRPDGRVANGLGLAELETMAEATIRTFLDDIARRARGTTPVAIS